MSKAEWIASIIGGVGAVTGMVSLVVAIVAVRHSRRSADHAGRSADHAGEAAVEARRLREIEADRRTDEKERRHEELAPDLPSEIEAELGGAWSAGQGTLFGSIRVDRAYRVRAYGRAGESLTLLSLPSVAAGRERVRFAIEPWAPGRDEPGTTEILFKFWPPVESVDRGEVWSCGCGRPGGETMEGPGHWERRVKVIFSRPD